MVRRIYQIPSKYKTDKTRWREHIERENDNGDDGQEGD